LQERYQINALIKTDHKKIDREKLIEKNPNGPGSWKLNISLLMNGDYILMLWRLIFLYGTIKTLE